MNFNIIKKILYSLILLALLQSCSTITSTMEPEGDARASPIIAEIEKFRDNTGHYPKTLWELVPKYLSSYDHTAYIYEHKYARGKVFKEYADLGLIKQGEGEGYVLIVIFQNHNAECIFINGELYACSYIGKDHG